MNLYSPPQTIGGFQVYVRDEWPKVQKGVETIHIPHHPFMTWLFGWLNRNLGARIPMTIEMQVPVYGPADPLVDQRRGTIYMSSGQYSALKKALHARRSEDPEDLRRAAG